MVIWVTTTKEGLLAERAAIMERFGLDERGFEPIEAWRTSTSTSSARSSSS